jgi:hypothetical protein
MTYYALAGAIHITPLDMSHQDYDIDDLAIPGTICLLDVDGRLDTKHSSSEKEIILFPAPSNDPEDPLNWTHRRKLLSTSCMFLYVSTTQIITLTVMTETKHRLTLIRYTWNIGISASVVYSVLFPLSEQTGLSITDINQGTGYLFLMCGWGLLFWQPLALQYGKRPVYLFSTLGSMVSFSFCTRRFSRLTD